MKMNIKGLVFVGFAAAVFASAANATGDKTVTSQAYVDGKFQTLANKLEQGSVSTNKLTLDGTNVDDTHYPTAKAVAQALTAANNSTDGKQAKSTLDYQVGNSDGSWTQLAGDSYVSIAAGTGADAGKAKLSVAATTDGTLADAVNETGANSADYNKLTTGHAVRAYADSKVATAVTDNDTTHAPSGEAVYEALALKQDTSTAVVHTENTAAGSGTHPVYIATDGTATATTYELNMTVPAAPDTDAANKVLAGDGSWKGVFTGADGSNAGTTGLVKAPAATDNGKFLKGDGTWADPANTEYDTLDSTDVSTGTGTTGKLITAAQHFAKQDKQLGLEPVGNNDSADKGKLVYIGADGKIAKAPDTLDVGTSTKGVYILDGVPTATTYSLGTNIPTPEGCTDAAPCALVATTSGAAWVSIAQPVQE